MVTESEEFLSVGAVLAPSVIVGASLAALYVLLRASPLNVFSPVGPFAVATLAYFGVGGLVPELADLPTQEYMRGMYDYSLSEVVAVHGISGIGVATLSVVAFWMLRGQPSEELVVGAQMNVAVFRRAILLLYGVGMIVTLAISAPAAIGLVRTPPAAIAQLGRLLTLSMLLISFGLTRGILARPLFVPAFLAALAVLLGGALLSLSKLEIFIQAGAAFGGFILARPSRRVIGVAAISVGISFAVLTPLILVARETSGSGTISLSSRIEDSRATLDLGNEILNLDDAPNIVLIRLQYVNAMAWARNEYNSGRPGTSAWKDGLWLLVPRTIWPSKPVLSRTGNVITDLTTSEGLGVSSTGVTIYGEAFWNAGFIGVVLISALVGAILGYLSIRSFDALTRLDVVSFPFVFTGALLGFRIDGFLFTDYLGQMIILALSYFLLRLGFSIARIETVVTSPRNSW